VEYFEVGRGRSGNRATQTWTNLEKKPGEESVGGMSKTWHDGTHG
jgi:hypothetical protein